LKVTAQNRSRTGPPKVRADRFKRTRVLFICTVLTGLSAFSVDIRAAAAPVHGLWVWKGRTVLRAPQGAQSLRDFCRSESVNEVYLSASEEAGKSDDQALSHLIGMLHQAQIRVEALVSSTTADTGGQPRTKLLEHVRAVLRFNQVHGAAEFDGIHIDVEPQQRPENKGEGNLRFLPGLVDTYREIRALAEPRGLTVNADIQSKLLKGDLAQRRSLLSSLPRVTLMLYELSSPSDGKSVDEKAGKLRETSKRMLGMAYQGLEDAHLAQMVIAVRTPDYGNLLPQMLRTLDEANGMNPHYLGWARHSYNDVLK
jgi:hypothetical protein